MPACRATNCLLAVVAAVICAQCGGSNGGSTPTVPTSPTLPPGTGGPGNPPPPSPSPPQIFAGAGDIGWCNSSAPEQTARLLDGLGGTVFAAGDLAYMNGTADDFRRCYDPSWGRHKSYTFPVPGNHEYQSGDPGPYFDYFGTNAGTRGLGYYGHELGDWHAIALNSLIPVDSGSAQAQWLRADLATHPNKCTLAYWHYPLFTSGPNGPQTAMRDLWRILYDANVEIVINGHDHFYERFAPQDPDGRPDSARGMREFIVGTGGADLYDFVRVSPNSDRQIKSYGVLKLTLQSGSYQWDFIPVGSGQSDSGMGTCH
jgi:hypothetical protein